MALSFIILVDLTIRWLKTQVYLRIRPLIDRRKPGGHCDADDDPSMFDVPTINADAVYKGEEIHFRPQVYTQRYYMIDEIIKKKSLNGGVKKVVDLGCAELALFSWLKNNLIAEEYIAVDIDEALLTKSSCCVQLGTSDYLFKRARPLNVKVLCGSADVPDVRLKGADLIVAVELIEHLYPITLEALPYCIFGVIQPEVAVFTTPNSDFNVLFRNFEGFRHDDHKFEWSREQFECWANNITSRYPNYAVKIGGVGPGPPGTEGLGYCSQLALFFRKGPAANTSDEFIEDAYKVVKNVDFPYQTLEDIKRDVLNYDTTYYLDKFAKNDSYIEDGRIVVPFKVLASVMNIKCECTDDEIREHLPSSWNIEQIGAETVLVLDETFETEFSDSGSEEQDDWVRGDNWGDDYERQENADSEFECWGTDPERDKDEAGCSAILNSVDAVDGEVKSRLSREEALETPSKTKDTPLNINSDFSADTIAIPKCLSLEQLTPNRSRNKLFRFSLNMDKSERNCDINCANNDDHCDLLASSFASVPDTVGLRLEDSCSQSKAVDSGYPNSSCFDMDTDLTPEQVDEIISESESSFDGDDASLSGDEQQLENVVGVVADVVVFHENVENGDVANNNRDGEGNNMEENLLEEEEEEEEIGDAEEDEVDLERGEEERREEVVDRASAAVDSSDDDPVSNVDTTSSVTDSNQPYTSSSGVDVVASQGHQGGDDEVDMSLLLSAITVRAYLPTTQSSSTFEAAISDELEDDPPDFRFPEWFLSVLNEEFAGGDGDPDYLHDDAIADYVEVDDDEVTIVDQADDEAFDDIDEEPIQGCAGDVQGGGDDPLIN